MSVGAASPSLPSCDVLRPATRKLTICAFSTSPRPWRGVHVGESAGTYGHSWHAPVDCSAHCRPVAPAARRTPDRKELTMRYPRLTVGLRSPLAARILLLVP